MLFIFYPPCLNVFWVWKPLRFASGSCIRITSHTGKLRLCCTQTCCSVTVDMWSYHSRDYSSASLGGSITVYIRKSGHVPWLAGIQPQRKECHCVYVIVNSDCWVLSVNSLSDSQHTQKYTWAREKTCCFLTSGETTESLAAHCY